MAENPDLLPIMDGAAKQPSDPAKALRSNFTKKQLGLIFAIFMPLATILLLLTIFYSPAHSSRAIRTGLLLSISVLLAFPAFILFPIKQEVKSKGATVLVGPLALAVVLFLILCCVFNYFSPIQQYRFFTATNNGSAVKVEWQSISFDSINKFERVYPVVEEKSKLAGILVFFQSDSPSIDVNVEYFGRSKMIKLERGSDQGSFDIGDLLKKAGD